MRAQRVGSGNLAMAQRAARLKGRLPFVERGCAVRFSLSSTGTSPVSSPFDAAMAACVHVVVRGGGKGVVARGGGKGWW